MTKKEFLFSLRARLKGLPREDIDERVGFYSEMIDDRMEEGLSEEDAVLDIGSLDDIAAEILKNSPRSDSANTKNERARKLRTWETVLLAAGSPIWFLLIIAAVSVILSLYVTLWALVISAWAIFAAFAGGAIGCVIGGTAFAVIGNGIIAAAVIGIAITLLGLAILAFIGCKAATKGTVILTGSVFGYVRDRISRRRAL